MAQSLTNGYDVVVVVNELELQRSIRQRFTETLGRFGLPAELELPVDGTALGMTGTVRLCCRLGLPESRLAPSRNVIDGINVQPETYPNAIEIKIPFIDSALVGANAGIGGLNLVLSLIFELDRIPSSDGEEVFGVDPASLVIWADASRTDQDPDAGSFTTRQKLGLLIPNLGPLTWTAFERALADILKDQPFVSELTSAIPGLEVGACPVTGAPPSSIADFDTATGLQCFDFEVVSDSAFRFWLAIKGMLSQPAVSTAIGTPTDPLDLSWSQSTDRAVAIVSNDFLLNEVLPRSLMAALLDPLLTRRERRIRDEVETDDTVAAADRRGEIARRIADMRQQEAQEHFSLRPFVMLQSVARNFQVPFKSEENANLDDTIIDRASIALIPDPTNPGSSAFRATFHATGGVPGVYRFDADISVLIRFSAVGGRVEPEIEADEHPRVDVTFENVVGVIAGIVATVTGAFTLGIGAIVTFIAYNLLELLVGAIASSMLPSRVNSNLGSDVDADLPEALPLVVRDVSHDDLMLRADLALTDDGGIQWEGLTPAPLAAFRLDLDHGSPTGGFPDINRRFDAFTGVTPGNADVDLVGPLVRARNGARLFDLGMMSLGRAVHVVQADIRAQTGNGVQAVQMLSLADGIGVTLLSFDNIEQMRVLPVHVIGVVTNEGNLARLIFVSGGSRNRCLYRRYRQNTPAVRLGRSLEVVAERRSGVLQDEITVFVTIPTDFGRGLDTGGFGPPSGFGRDRPTEFVVKVGSEIRQLAYGGHVGMSTTLLLQPFRSIVWSVTTDRAGNEQVIPPGAPHDISVPSNAVVTFTVHDDLRRMDFVSRVGATGDFLVRVTVIDYRGTQATQVVPVQFEGSRFITTGFDRVRDLMDLDGRLGSGREGVPGRPGPEPDPSPENFFAGDKFPSRDGKPGPGRPGRREMARRTANAAFSRSEFNRSDPRAALLQHLSRRSRQASGAKSEAVIERAVEEWTTAILSLPDAQTLANRHRKRRSKASAACEGTGAGKS